MIEIDILHWINNFIFDVQAKELTLERLSSQKPHEWIIISTWRAFFHPLLTDDV